MMMLMLRLRDHHGFVLKSAILVGLDIRVDNVFHVVFCILLMMHAKLGIGIYM